MTTEQIEQKKQQLKQLAEEVKQLKDDLIELSEDELNHVAGGSTADENWRKMVLEFAEMP